MAKIDFRKAYGIPRELDEALEAVRTIILETMPGKAEKLNKYLNGGQFDFTKTDINKLSALSDALDRVIVKAAEVVMDPGTKPICGRYPWGKEDSE